MRERSETALPPVHLGAGWGLNLTAQRRKRLLRCRLLRLVTPFLALGGRYGPQAVAARSFGLLPAMPWLAPRWWERPEREATTAHANEPVTRPPRATSPPLTPPVRPPWPPPGQPTIALTLALHRAWAGLGTPGRRGSKSPARVSPFLGDLRKPAPAEPVVPPVRTRRETSKAGTARQADNLPVLDSKATDQRIVAGAREEEAGSPLRIQPQILPYHTGTARQADNLPVPDSKATDQRIVAGARGEEAGSPPGFGRRYGSMPSRLPKMALLSGPPSVFRGLAPGISPAAFNRIMIPAAPGQRAEQAELLFRSPPEAVDTQERPPLPEPKLPGDLKTVAPGPVSLQGLSLVLETIRHTMKREVAAAIREREEEAQSLASNRASGIDLAPAENLVNEHLVRLFMRKMRELAEEERFRLGLLR